MSLANLTSPDEIGKTKLLFLVLKGKDGRIRSDMQAWRRTAQSVEALALSLEREVPDTAATMRLSGLELADAIGEVTLLGADLTEVRAPTSAAEAACDACALLSCSQKCSGIPPAAGCVV